MRGMSVDREISWRVCQISFELRAVAGPSLPSVEVAPDRNTRFVQRDAQLTERLSDLGLMSNAEVMAERVEEPCY